MKLGFLGLVWLASAAMTVSGLMHALSAPGRWSGFVVMLTVTALATILLAVSIRGSVVRVGEERPATDRPPT
ncbi:hypothetical protein [Asanoa iriomotensis]|uniref:Uncharacterized protein n=1 Tax=Asanoa iriomotensis TaxID=234613 RepID=A0ABQ4C2B9_9ACTN|nr:hypothetical protein [Asanoa iriomotensis]GIF56576.1 hypothetical protein Air01nite_26710 [Asanoa iriomotensis]